MLRTMCLVSVLCVGSVAFAQAAELRSSLVQGTPDLQSAGPLAFGPEGILFLGDPQAAAIFAIDTEDAAGDPSRVVLQIDRIDEKIAALLGTTPREILIQDLAINPASGNGYLSVSRGRGPDAQPVLMRVAGSGQITQVPLQDVRFAKASLSNAPPEGGTGRRNRRQESITDLAWVEGRLIVAGLSNEEFASKLRSIPFPFETVDGGTSVEIYHGAHGAFETRSPVRTFVPYNIGDEPYLLAAYTCTPLVKFPLTELQPGTKVRGTTVAELGNRNRPLDMIVYQQDGRDYVLMANSSRGLMKISAENIATIEGITRKIDDTAGLPYETIEELQGVVQLDRLNSTHAVVLLQPDQGPASLQTIALP